MGLFSGLFRARDAPQNRTSGSAYSFFMGGSTSGKRVNERSSMPTCGGTLPCIRWRCVSGVTGCVSIPAHLTRCVSRHPYPDSAAAMPGTARISGLSAN